MPEPFRGSINVDIRDSEPDWAPFEPPKAPEGAPNVVYIVLDDVGFSAMSCYGGPIETPNIDRIADAGVRYTQWHTTALCSPTRSCLLTGRNHTRNSMACITEAAIGFPNASGTIPPENGMLSEILGERGWNTYMVGKWHLCPTDEMNLAATRRNWPSGRGFERWYGFLGAETNQWYPGPRLRQPPRRPAPLAGRGLSPDRRHHRQGARVHQGRQGGRAGEAVLPVLRPRRVPRPAPRPEGVDRQVQGPLRRGLRGASARRPWPGRRSSGSSRPTPSCRPSTRSARPRPGTGPTASRSRPSTTPGRGTRSTTTRSALFARMAEVYAGFLAPRRPPHRTPARLPRAERRARQHHDRGRVRQRRERRGRPERLGQRDEVRQRRRRRPGAEPGPDRRARRPAHLQPLPDRLGDGLQHAVQDVEALRVQRRHLRPVHHLLAGRAQGPRRDPRPVPPRRSTSCRRSWTCSASTRPRRSRATCRARSTGSACAPASTTPPPRRAEDPVLRHARAPARSGTRAGRRSPPTRAIVGLGPLQRRRVGALPHRRRPRRDRTTWPPSTPTSSGSWSSIWFSEAGANGAFPLDDRSAVEIVNTPRPQLTAARTATCTAPATAPVSEWQAVNTRGRSFVIGALVDIPEPGAEGVLFAFGSRFGGHALYVKDNRLHYVNNFVGSREQMIVGSEDIPTGHNLILSASFEKKGLEPTTPPGPCRSTTATTRSARPRSRPSSEPSPSPAPGSTSAGTPASRSPTTTPASRPTRSPAGTIDRVAVDVSGEPLRRSRARGRPDAHAGMIRGRRGSCHLMPDGSE